MVKRTLLLFDIDGTLMLSGGAGLRAMRRVGGSLFGDDFSWDGIEAGGNLDPLIFQQAAINNQLDDAQMHHERFREMYLLHLAEELEQGRQRIEVMPGVHALLAMLRQRDDVEMGLLTGNYTHAVPIKLGMIDVDPRWFTVTAFGDEAATRLDLVELAMQKYQARYGQAIEPGRVIVIGDTPRDVACAKAHGCVAFGVGTGQYSAAQLRKCGADVAVDDLADRGAGVLLGLLEAG